MIFYANGMQAEHVEFDAGGTRRFPTEIICVVLGGQVNDTHAPAVLTGNDFYCARGSVALFVSCLEGHTVEAAKHELPVVKQEVRELQRLMSEKPQFDGFRTTHYFAGNLYARSVWRPQDVLVIGGLHKHEHLSVLLSGTMHIGSMIHAPHVFVTAPSTKRGTYSYTDAEFLTIHRLPTRTRDLDAIERQLIDSENDSPRLYDADNRLKPIEVSLQ